MLRYKGKLQLHSATIFLLILLVFNLLACIQFFQYNSKARPLDTSSNLQTTTDGADLLWNITWGGYASDRGQKIAFDNAGNVYVAGASETFSVGSSDLALIKFFPNGTRSWNVTWGGTGYESASGIAIDNSGGIYCTGVTTTFGVGMNEIALVKFHPNGTIAWNVTWGGSNGDTPREVACFNGYIYIIGYTYSLGDTNGDIVLIKYNSDGLQIWNTTWGGSSTEEGYCLTIDASGNILCGGYSTSYGENNLILLKFDQQSNLLWNTSWGGPSSESAQDLTLDDQGNIYCVGDSQSFAKGGLPSDLVLLKFSPDGSLAWNRTSGIVGDDKSSGIVIDKCGFIYCLSTRYSDTYKVALLKYSINGAYLWNTTWGGSSSEFAHGMALDSNGNIYCTGMTLSFGAGNYDLFLLKFKTTTVCGGGNSSFIWLLLLFPAIGIGLALIIYYRRIERLE